MKKTWIENKKIKSKWKAEKRKEGLVNRPSDLPLEPNSEKEDEEAEEVEDQEGTEDSETDRLAPTSVPVPAPVSASASSGRALGSVHPDRKSYHAKNAPAEKTPESLRELTRKAYSRESLHSFKADPLGRHKGRGGATQRGGRGGRGRGRGGHVEGVGRGQPNMKLRMDSMLEKIKRDFA